MSSEKGGRERKQVYLRQIAIAFGKYDDRKPHEEPKTSLRDVASRFGMSTLKARKLLITAGVYSTELSRAVADLQKDGLSIEQIGEKLNLGRASVHSYLPYTKGTYKIEPCGAAAKRTRVYRERLSAKDKLLNAGSESELDRNQILWSALESFQGYLFHGEGDRRFSFQINDHEMKINKEDKSIPREDICVAYERAIQLGGNACVPQGAENYVAKYLRPIFVHLTIIKE